MASLMYIFLEIIETMEKIQLSWFQTQIATLIVYINCQLG